MRRALLSVSDKTGVVSLARGLHARGFALISTGGTARILTEAGLAVTAVSDVTGFPELLGGRVKTLHPGVHAGILARRERRDDMAAIAQHGIEPIDLVAVNLYPFTQTAERATTTAGALLEEIDIGGPTLLRAAAKNLTSVLVVVDPDDYADLLDQLDAADGPSLEFRLAQARKAFSHTARYDRTIASTLGRVVGVDGELAYAAPASSDAALWLDLRKIADLRYGENPHQAAAWYAGAEWDTTWLDPVQGKALSFTNLLDLDAALRIVQEFEHPAAAIVKHTNPSGVATGASLDAAYRSARDADALSAFGGIVGLNRAIDVDTARSIASTFIEAVVAPGIEDAARAVLAAKRSMRVVVAESPGAAGSPGTRRALEVRSILGGVLVQELDAVVEGRAAWSESSSSPRVVTQRSPSTDEWTALRFAWRVCAHVKSNAIVFAETDRTLAIGAGQTSRVDAVRLAVSKVGSGDLGGSVAASDAFFPFRDGVDAIAQAGATAVVQPGGSVRDPEVIAAADERGLAMVFTGRRHFRH